MGLRARRWRLRKTLLVKGKQRKVNYAETLHMNISSFILSFTIFIYALFTEETFHLSSELQTHVRDRAECKLPARATSKRPLIAVVIWCWYTANLSLCASGWLTYRRDTTENVSVLQLPVPGYEPRLRRRSAALVNVIGRLHTPQFVLNTIKRLGLLPRTWINELKVM